MTIETITILLYVWLSFSLVFPMAAIFLIMQRRRLKIELKKQTKANRYYEEMLYASKDGYLTFSLYKDKPYKDKPYQYCSRRLATLLNLKNGEKSTLKEVLNIFERVDAEKINVSFMALQRNGLSFEVLAHTKTEKTFVVTGVSINSIDSEINAACLWFRDVTQSSAFVKKVTLEALACREKMEDYRILIDNLKSPVWLRDDKLNITLLNRPYLNLVGLKDFKEVTFENTQLHDLGNTTNFLEIARTAKDSNTAQKKQINILANGDLRKYELIESPYYDSSLKTTRTIGSLVDITEFDEAKLNYQVHLETHLEILSSLDTAFAIINNRHNFTFVNHAFLKLWELPDSFIDNAPHYNLFLDALREKKSLPEVSDFKAYKEEENQAFDALTEQREDMLYLPDGRTFRRIRAPHPDGTLIAYEDISERLADARRLNDVLAVQQRILDNLEDSVIIFSPALKLKTYNLSFLTLWETTAPAMEEGFSLKDILDLQKNRLPEMDNWDKFRDDMQKHIISCTPFTLKLKNKQKIGVMPSVLPDSSLMIVYHKQ